MLNKSRGTCHIWALPTIGKTDEKKYHIEEINIARMKGVNINYPIMKEFLDNLERVNNLAERCEGFV
ncbi:DUF3291 domain-containing protein [Ekhidna sp.]|uniref:DUF3291 domain-containing protein n=1 Tax=Ekhidna sp. TaxID=2608089 RepID=UPI00329958B6